jgi:lysozyme
MAFSTLNSTAFSALDAISGGTTLEQLSPDQIKELQGVLKSLGYGLDADGVLGPLTKTVWASFKSDNGLDQPDAIGPSSIALLRQRLSGGAADDVPPQAVTIVKTFEGFSAHAYDDGTGVWTIGYGTTAYPDGGRVASGQTATEAQAVTYLTHDMASTAKTLAGSVPYWSTMSADQRSALISFGYNLGAAFYGASDFNSISSALRDHRWSDVPRVFALYSDPGDAAVHQGLLRRRIAEGDLWQGKGQFAASA